MQIEILRALADNYVYLIVEGDEAAVVDPSDAIPVLRAVAAQRVRLVLALVTHGHADHTAGCAELRQATGCRVAGPASAPVDVVVHDGASMALGSLRLRTVAAPGHTADHVLYHEPGRRVLFTGDALFVGGCGRRFGVGADVMWRSLRLLRELPDDTQVYCGHEYGEDNLEFAAQIEPANPAIARRRAALEQRLRAGHPGVPSLLGEEKATNPFLRADVDAVGRAVGLPDGGPVEVFAELRRRKDEW